MPRILIPHEDEPDEIYEVRVDPIWAWVFREYKWFINRFGYCYRKSSIKIDGKWRSMNVYLHRMIMGLEYGNPLNVDHLNSDRLDCRIENLEVVTAAENQRRRSRQD